ncbi:unnamed protein product, partial [Brenthis ino]
MTGVQTFVLIAQMNAPSGTRTRDRWRSNSSISLIHSPNSDGLSVIGISRTVEKIMTLINFILFLSVLMIAFAATVPSTDDDVKLVDDEQEDGDRTISDFLPCKKKNNMSGLCVPFSYCNANQSILPGGYIDTDMRELHNNECQRPGSLEWCCSTELLVQPPEVTTHTVDKCLPLESDICTWCVTLHKVRDSSIADVPAFCAGALIGSKVILTAASCLVAAYNQTLFAQVPASPDKTRKYEADLRKLNPSYNSGTRWNDFGIIVLKEEVNWGTMPASGACLNPVKIGGNCMTFGLDINDNIVSTIIQVTESVCDNMGGGGSLDIFCGKSKEKECFAVTGAPVVCESGNNGLLLVGVSRSGCIDGNIALGNYLVAKPWLVMELNAMKVPNLVYTL